ncbi:hypothetical protein tb265_49750 [Gemmatimonadetes bacterium T265]|nr:hypothetical protein tb265_49750 [Gemmatimonadetes bacterium T265]
MRTLAICGRSVPAFHADNDTIGRLHLDGVPVLCGVLDAPDPRFDAAGVDRRRVLVRVRAFSCNYRDKAVVLRAAVHLGAQQFFSVGSEFAGEVAAVGRDVTRVRAGDRVIGDNTYAPDDGAAAPDGPHPGIPTNNASRELLLVHEDKVMPIPAGMPDDVAAAFGLGAQTAFSMVDKLALRPGNRVLVTAATSNTSLFAIQALRGRGVDVYATSTSGRQEAALAAAGVRELFVVDPAVPRFSQVELLAARAAAFGGFDGVVDPFFDLYLPKVLSVMKNGGRYVTCGLHGQYLDITGSAPPAPPPDWQAVLGAVVARNVSLIGNCLGRRRHLEAAIGAWQDGSFDVRLDSVQRGGGADAFLSRTFEARERFGKVVYAYA